MSVLLDPVIPPPLTVEWVWKFFDPISSSFAPFKARHVSVIFPDVLHLARIFRPLNGQVQNVPAAK